MRMLGAGSPAWRRTFLERSSVTPARDLPIDAGAHLSRTNPGIAAEDWDLLFRAVVARLERSAREAAADAALAPGFASLQLECSAALEQLRTAMSPDLHP
jgi:hypothetical protein